MLSHSQSPTVCASFSLCCFSVSTWIALSQAGPAPAYALQLHPALPPSPTTRSESEPAKTHCHVSDQSTNTVLLYAIKAQICLLIHTLLGYQVPDQQTEKFSYLILSRTDPADMQGRAEGVRWARLTAPVLRRPRHVHCQMCSPSGELQRLVVTSHRHGRCVCVSSPTPSGCSKCMKSYNECINSSLEAGSCLYSIVSYTGHDCQNVSGGLIVCVFPTGMCIAVHGIVIGEINCQSFSQRWTQTRWTQTKM